MENQNKIGNSKDKISYLPRTKVDYEDSRRISKILTQYGDKLCEVDQRGVNSLVACRELQMKQLGFDNSYVVFAGLSQQYALFIQTDVLPQEERFELKQSIDDLVGSDALSNHAQRIIATEKIYYKKAA